MSDTAESAALSRARRLIYDGHPMTTLAPPTMPGLAPDAATDGPLAGGPAVATAAPRVRSIDVLRGLVMFTMIFVNDLAGAPESIVPHWMQHFHGRDGMTFVDLVFPAFLFLVGMSVPFALGARRSKGEPIARTLLHVAARAGSLLMLGVLMVNGTPNSKQMGWSGPLWWVLLLPAAALAFGDWRPPRRAGAPGERGRRATLVLRVLRLIGWAGLVALLLTHRSRSGRPIVRFEPFSVRTQWWGILGLIGWAYLVAAVAWLVCRDGRTGLLACVALLTSFYAADRHGAFERVPFNDYVNLGGTLGSQAAIAVAGAMLATILRTPDTATHCARIRFALCFVVGFAAAAWVVRLPYGIQKNAATPAWCLWAVVVTAALWLLMYLLVDTGGRVAVVGRPLALAGRNVLLAYLISETAPTLVDMVGGGDWYDRLAGPDLAHAVARSAGCALAILTVSVGVNRAGFGLRL